MPRRKDHNLEHPDGGCDRVRHGMGMSGRWRTPRGPVGQVLTTDRPPLLCYPGGHGTYRAGVVPSSVRPLPKLFAGGAFLLFRVCRPT